MNDIMDAISSLPDGILIKILKFAARRGEFANRWSCCDLYKNDYDYRPCKFDHNFLVDVVSKVSVRFEKLSKHKNFWRDRGSVFKLLCIANRSGTNLDSLPDEIALKIVKMAAGSLVQNSTGGVDPRWIRSPGVPEWFRSRFRGHCCYKYRTPMGYQGGNSIDFLLA